MDNEGLILKIDGDDSGYEQTLKNAQKKAKETAQNAKKAIEEANKAVQKAMSETDPKAKATADKIAKEARQAADAAIKEAEKAQKEISAKMNKINSDASSVMQGINSAAKKTALGIAAAGAAVLGMGVNYNAQMEQYTASFTTMLGSAEKAKETIADLKGFAEKTPFELTDLANASTTLLAFGEDINDLMPDLKTLGDISLGNAEKFKGRALVFGQVKSQGRLMGQDLLQMINQGFNPLQIISEKTGKSMAKLKDEMADGKISFEMVADAMKTATSEGGQFYNAMENQSNTFNGQLSTLKDNVVSFFGEVSGSVSNTLTEDVLPKAISLTEDLKEAWTDGSLQKGIGTAVSVTAALGTVIVGLNLALFIHDLSQLKKGVEGYTAATKLGTAAQKAFNAAQLATPTGLLCAGLAAVVVGLVVYEKTHKSAAEEAIEANKEIIKSLEDLEQEYADAVISIDEKANAEIAEAQTVETLKDELYSLEHQYKNGNKTTEEATEIEKEFAAIAAKLEETIPGITSALYDENGAIDIQKGKVDTLTQSYLNLAEAKVLATAYEEKMVEIEKKIIDAQAKKDEALKNFEVAEKNRRDTKTNNERIEFAVDKDGYADYNWLVDTKTGKKHQNNAPGWYDDRKEEWSTAAEANKEAAETLRDLEKERKTLKKGFTDALKNLTKAEEKYYEESGNRNDDHTGKVVANNSTKTTSTKNSLKDQNKAIKEAYEEEYRNLKFRKEMGEITEEEYYNELEKLRDKYFDKNDEEWQSLTLEIKKHLDEIEEENRKTYEKMRKDAIKEIEKLADKHKSIVDNLKSDKQTYTFKFGDSESETYSGFVDMAFSNSQLKEYENLLLKLEEKFGEIPDKIKDDLTGLTAAEAIAYIKPILSMSDEDFNRIMTSYTENESLASGIADILIDNDAEEMVNGFKEKFGEIPEDFFVIGQESGEQFGKSFIEKMQNVCAELREKIQKELIQKVVDEFQTKMQAVIDRGNKIREYAAGNTTTYADYRTTNIYAASSSPHDIAEATKQQSIYEKHTSRG